MAVAMREAWSDDRLDDLNRKVDAGFKSVGEDLRGLRTETKTEIREVKSEIRDLRREMNTRSELQDARFDALQRTLIVCFGGVIAGLVGIIITQF
jgi:peptidoglycan hydrolase CwlO-like protein